MIRTRYGIMIAVLILTSIVFCASAQTETVATASGPDKTSNPGDVVKITGPTGSYAYTWTISPSVSPAPGSTTAQAFSFTVPKTSPAPLYTVTLLVKSTVEGSCTNSRVITIAVNMPIAISGKKAVCLTAVNEPYSVAPDLAEGQTIEWSLDGKPLDEKYNKNPTAITWADFASGITATTTKNLVAKVKNSAGNVVSTSPTFPVQVVPIPVTTITIA